MNNRISAKERGLLKGAIRRVFSRSDLRRKVVESARIEHIDTSRPRVKKWGQCSDCKQPTALYQMQIDHRDPIVPVDTTLEAMSWDTVVNRVWCEENGLAAVCKSCHTIKTKQENATRRKNKRKATT